MLKNVFFIMSLSGTVVFLFYLFMYPLSERYFSLKWRYRILKIAMMFYLFPFPLCKYYVWGFFYDHFSFIREIADKYEFSAVNADYIIIANRDSIRLSPKIRYIYMAVFLVMLISFFILGKQLIQYRKIMRVHFLDLGESSEGKLQEIFFKRKVKLNIKRKVKLICSEYCETPITSGVMFPTVLFPKWNKDNEIDEELCEYIITHELVHIKHNDVLIKLIGLLAVAIHWFNPFVYLLFGELSCISEMYCDSVVMDGKGKEERNRYGNLLLKLIMENSFLEKRQFGVGFANLRKKSMCKRRILEMKKSKKHNVFLSVIIAVFICMAGGATVFAYQPPSTITNDGPEITDANGFSISQESILPDKLDSDYFAVSDSGTVYDLSHTDGNARANCSHNYSISVEVTKHTKDGKGGCIVKIYDGLKCSKCADVKLGKLLSTVTYMPCPH